MAVAKPVNPTGLISSCEKNERGVVKLYVKKVIVNGSAYMETVLSRNEMLDGENFRQWNGKG